jgi:hypothetical protein
MIFLMLAGSYPTDNQKCTDKLLNELLGSKWASHFADVLDFPVPQVTRLGADTVAADVVHEMMDWDLNSYYKF